MKRLLFLFFLIFVSFGFSQNEKLDTLIIRLAYQSPNSFKVDTSVSIIKLLYEAEDYNKAQKFIPHSETLAKDLDYKKGLAQIAYYKASIHNKQDDFAKAILEFKNSKSIYTSIKDTLEIARINSSLGVLEIENGNYKQGLSYALSAINELEKRELYPDLSNNYKSLADVYQKSDNLEKAITYNLKRLDVDTKINNTEGLINANKNLGNIYTQKKNYKLAISYYESALGYAELSDKKLRAKILPYLGNAYLKDKDYKTSGRYLAEAIKLNRKLKNNSEILFSFNTLGDLNLKQKRYKTAEVQLQEAIKLGRITDNDQELLRTYSLMKTLDSTKGKFESAFVWQREYHALKEKIQNKKKPNTLVIGEADFVEESIEDSLVLTNNTTTDDSVSKKKLDKFKLIFYALLAAFAIVLTFFILFYSKGNKRLKYTRDLEAENKKIELQNEAILEQSKNLEKINNVKDKLFSIVSHDLKDSLTSTKGFIDLLKEGQLTQDEFHSLLPELSENANNASLLLFNLLNWSKTQMQSLEPKPSLFDIQEVFAEKAKLMDQKIEAKGIKLINNTFQDFIYADRNMVEIVIQNLLANAVKFCNTGDTITLTNQNHNSKTILCVQDTGVGINKNDQGKLFGNNTFTTRGTNKEKGTGLGLTICRELVELNKGTIWVESAPNAGSTFYVELPKTKTDIDPDETSTRPLAETPQPSYSEHYHLHKPQ